MLWTAFPCLAWHRIGMDPRSTQPLGTISVPLGPWHFSISLPITSCGLLLFGKFAKKEKKKTTCHCGMRSIARHVVKGMRRAFIHILANPTPSAWPSPLWTLSLLGYSWGKTTIRRIDACCHGTWGSIASYVAFAMGIETLYRQAFFFSLFWFVLLSCLFCSFLVLLILVVRSSSWARG